MTAAPNSSAPPPPLPGMWWIQPGLILAGPSPNRPERGERGILLNALLAAEIRTFVSLQQEGEGTWRMRRGTHYAEEVQAWGREHQDAVSCVQFPIRDMDVTDFQTYRLILTVMRAAVEFGRGVYVHCLAGHGRTGTVAGIWHVERGLDGEEALAALARSRAHDPVLAQIACPQTESQRAVILGWRRTGR